MPNNISTKFYLTNVAVIRLILIILLVFYHAFAIYSGAWDPIDGYPEVKMYYWLDKVSFAFLLEMFVFVSGYVFGYQVRIQGKSKLEAKSLFISKFKRLIIPSIVFSLLYIIIFRDFKDYTQSITKTIYEVVCGYAHMWFLPMLFWCFVGIWIIERLRLKPRVVFPFLLLCSLFSFVPLPFQMTKTLYYMFFFYAGYLIQRNNVSVAKFTQPVFIVSLMMAFIVLFPLLTIFKEKIGVILIAKEGFLFCNRLIGTLILSSLQKMATIIYSTIGLVLLFLFVEFFTNKTQTLPKWLVDVGRVSMGVYLLQQFVLKALYLFTSLPLHLGPMWLPWVGFAITLVVSIVLSYLLRLTKIGRFLIG